MDNRLQEQDIFSDGYDPEDAAIYHILSAFLCRHFSHHDAYEQHRSCAKDHASNGGGISPSEVDSLIDEGPTTFGYEVDHLVDPRGFQGIPEDINIGQYRSRYVERLASCCHRTRCRCNA